MTIYAVDLDPPLLSTEVEAESEADAIELALRIFEGRIGEGTWRLREVEES